MSLNFVHSFVRSSIHYQQMCQRSSSEICSAWVYNFICIWSNPFTLKKSVEKTTKRKSCGPCCCFHEHLEPAKEYVKANCVKMNKSEKFERRNNILYTIMTQDSAIKNLTRKLEVKSETLCTKYQLPQSFAYGRVNCSTLYFGS